ncbi:desiccation protectant protein Lea14 [Tanacetum coccineum]|uniref:Desiccation protectant protein Lea14 n=1 Tax=Tanacetum coccineum TaxID=301880 RepID=A0ABQ5GAM5_9ASTR
MAGILDKAKQYVSDKVASMAKPEASVTDVDLKGVSLSNVTYLAKVNVTNPYSASIPIGEIRYVLKSCGSVIAEGRCPDPGSLKGNGDTMLDIEIKVPHSLENIFFVHSRKTTQPLLSEIALDNYCRKNMSGLLEEAEQFVSDAMASIPKPKATVTDVDFKGIGLDSVTYNAKVSVSNPYIAPIPIGEVHYILKSAGRVIATGTVPDQGSLKGSGDTLLNVEVKVPHTVLISLVEDIAVDWDIDYELQVNLVFDLPFIGDISIPITKTGVIKLPSLANLFA